MKLKSWLVHYRFIGAFLAGLLVFTSISPALEAIPGGAQGTSVPRSYLPILYRENSGTPVAAGNKCPDPLPRPIAAGIQSNAAESTAAAPPNCVTDFVDSAPAVIEKMPTTVGAIELALGALGDTRSYHPRYLTRDHFGGFIFASTREERLGIGITAAGGWAHGTTLQFEAVTSGIVITTTPRVSWYDTCSTVQSDRDVPFLTSLKYSGDGSAAAKSTGGTASATVSIGSAEDRCPAADGSDPGAVGPPPWAVAIFVEQAPGLVPQGGASTFSGGVDKASGLRYRMTLGGDPLGEMTSHIFRPYDYSYPVNGSPSADATRRPFLAVPADLRGGTFYANTGEYVAPFDLFSTKGAGIAVALSLNYSSFDSLLYRATAALPTADKYVPTPFGQGWSYNYGIRLLKRPYTSAPERSVLELIGPAGERTVLNDRSDEPKWAGAPAWAAGGAVVVETATGYQLSELDGFLQYAFDKEGRLTEIRDIRYATPLTIAYSGGEQVVTDSGGKVVRFRYTGERITEVLDPLGNSWTFTYTNDSLTAMTHQATAYKWRFAYDTSLFVLKSILEPDCRRTKINYLQGTEAEATYATTGSFKSSQTATRDSITDHTVEVTYLANRTIAVRGVDQGITNFRSLDWDGQPFSCDNVTCQGPRAPFQFEMTDALGQKHELEGYDKIKRHRDPAANETSWPLYLNNLPGGVIFPENKSKVEFFFKNTDPPTYPRALEKSVQSPTLGSSTPITTTYRYDSQHRLTTVIAADDDPTSPSHPTRYEYDTSGRIITKIDAEGRVTRYAYGTAAGKTNLIISQTQEASDGQKISTYFNYDALGNMVAVVDERGGVWLYNYDTFGRLTTITLPVTGSTPATEQFTYDVSGRLIKHRDVAGRETAYTYRDEKLDRIVYPNGGTESFSYDIRGYMTGKTNVLGGISRYSYDALGRVTEVTGPNGENARYAYDAAGNMLGQTIGSDTIEYVYDPLGQATEVTPPSITVGGASFQPVQKMVYDGFGPPIAERTLVRPGAEQGTRAVFDILGRELEMHAHSGPPDPKLSVSFYSSKEYDNTGLVTAINGLTSAWGGGTDRPANIVSSALSKPARRAIEYDGFGRAISVADNSATDSPAKAMAKWHYDPAGNVSRVEMPAHPRPTGQQGLAGVSSLPGELTARAVATHDALGQLTELSDAEGRSIHLAYDTGGNFVWMKDERDCTTVFTYDVDDNLTRILSQEPGSAGRPTRLVAADYAYDLAGNMTSSVGPYEETGAVTAATGLRPGRSPSGAPAGAPTNSASYDTSGRTITMTVGTRVFRFEYRAGDGQLDKVIDASGKQIKYEYEAGRVQRITDSTGQELEIQEFDGLGRPVRAQRGQFTKEWRYEHNIGIPSQVTWTVADGQGSHSYSVDIKVDDKGRLGQVTNPDGSTTRYWYNQDGRLRKMVRDGKQWTYGYDSEGELISLSLPNEVTASAGYNQNGRLASWDVDRGTTGINPALSREYEYGHGVVSVKELTIAGSVIKSEVNTTYNWSKLGLESEVATAADRSLIEKMTYSSGDRTSLVVEGERASNNSYEYWANTNELAKVTPGEAPCSASTLFVAHDPTGNVRRHSCEHTIQTGLTYDYDQAGRLTGVTSDDPNALGNFSISYAYDAEGGLAKRSDSASGETTYWVDLQEFGFLQELNADFSPKNTYVVDPFGTKLGRFDSQAASRYYLYDPEGRLAIISDGNQTGHVSFQPRLNSFGMGTRLGYSDSTLEERFAFGGLFLDERTGLVQFAGDRWYHPATGRFLQPSGATGTASAYQFAGLAPLPGTMPDAPEDGTASAWDTYWTVVKVGLMLNPITAMGMMQYNMGKHLVERTMSRYRTLSTQGGMSKAGAGALAGSLFIADLLGAGSAIEAAADYNAREGGRAFTTGEKWLAYGELGLSLVLAGVGGRLMGGVSRGVSTGAKASTRVIPATNSGVSRAARGGGELFDNVSRPDVGPPIQPEILDAIVRSANSRGTVVRTGKMAQLRVPGRAAGTFRARAAGSGRPEVALRPDANLGSGFHEIAHELVSRFMRSIGRDPGGLSRAQHEYLVTRLIRDISQGKGAFRFNEKYLAHNERKWKQWVDAMPHEDWMTARSLFDRLWRHLESGGRFPDPTTVIWGLK